MSLRDFLGSGAGGEVVRVQLNKVQGSSPRDVGAEMFVSCGGTTFGTIGGGQLEYLAIEAARKLMIDGRRTDEIDIPLGPEIGQCCGGRVSVSLTRMSESDQRAALEQERTTILARPHLYIMGAGHVGRALANQLQNLPFQTIIVDQRASELAKCAAQIDKRLTALPEHEIATAPKGSAFIVLTHDHSLDFLLTAAALQRGDAAYIGLIGSATKRTRFEKWFQQNCDAADSNALVCPIGRTASSDKRPEIIAAFVVAEVVAALLQNDNVAQVNQIPSDKTSRDCVLGLPRLAAGDTIHRNRNAAESAIDTAADNEVSF